MTPARVLARGPWLLLLIAADAVVVMIATIATYFARFEGAIPIEYAIWMPWLMLVSVVVYVTTAWVFGLYWVVLRYAGLDTLVRTAVAVAVSSAILVTGDLVVGWLRGGLRTVPLGVLVIQTLFVFIGMAGVRIAFRAKQFLRAQHRRQTETNTRLLIAGAGSAGSLLLRELHARPDLDVTVVGFLDDDSSLRGSIIGGVRVLGAIDELEDLVRRLDIGQLYVALPSAEGDYVRRILNRAADIGLSTRIMPQLVIEKGHIRLSDMRKVDVEDLLGRELTPIDVEQVRSTIAGKVVAVTGAAGSIGSELCRQIIALSPASLLLLDIDESRLYELWLELEAASAGVSHMHILDIRSAQKCELLFNRHRPQVVLHAAAYKHVPLMEMEPAEALATNVIGSDNVMRAASASGAERFVLISTDKAVSPESVMGKTKELAERLMLAYVESEAATTFVAVRFGNVLGSRGSVLPIFEEQLARGGPLTVTDPEVSRFFMLIPEAARLVLQAQAIGSSGDTFVLEMGEPVRIAELAHRMIALAGVPSEVVFSGLRPGERLHETLHSSDEVLVPTSREKILRVSRSAARPLRNDELAVLKQLAADGTVTAPMVLDF